ncbi:sodium transporter hkt1 [Quercus suber]|uniref:Sodium transporter hkt1 n=1 Tax=Quercus suber TaxID=58331 RepID=A0AAW0KI81_QUESU
MAFSSYTIIHKYKYNSLTTNSMVSIFGHLALMVLKPRTSWFRPKDFDMFFTSFQACQQSKLRFLFQHPTHYYDNLNVFWWRGIHFLSWTPICKSKFSKNYPSSDQNSVTLANLNHNFPNHTNSDNQIDLEEENNLHLIGSGLVSLYVNLVPSARKVLKDKGLETLTFSVFTTISTFTNCELRSPTTSHSTINPYGEHFVSPMLVIHDLGLKENNHVRNSDIY